MKHLKIALIALMTIGAFNLGNAQSKVAHISTQQLIESMPGYQDAKSEMSKMQNSYKSKLEDMQKELQEKNDNYQSEVDDVSDEENEKRMKEMQESQQRVREFQQNAQEDMNDKQEELMKPLLEKAKNAIEKVAKDEGYDYVLDSTEGGGVLVANGSNLMDKVRDELDLDESDVPDNTDDSGLNPGNQGGIN